MTMAGRALLGATLMAALLPPSSEAQPVARTFAELRTVLKPTEYVIVVDRAARETWGKVTSVTDETLTVAPMLKTENRIETTGDRRPFPEERVAAVFRSDATGARGAGVYPVSWARVEAVPAGTELTVVLASGERRNYRAAGLTADTLRVLTSSGQEETLRKSDVLRIERRGVNDPVSDGIVIGALAGAGAGAGLMAAAYAACSGSCEAPAPGPMFLGAMSMGAGVGALAGWIADRAHKGKESIFPTVVTFVTRDRKGIALSIRF
jgi:hypothetical protein